MLLRVEAAALVALTVVLAGPVSAGLARARWPSRAPRAALVLWQAVGLGGGLGVLTAGLTLAASDVGRHWVAGLVAVPGDWSLLGPSGWFGVALTVCVGGWLVGATVASTGRVLAARRIHRHRLDVIADAFGAGPPERAGDGRAVRLVDHPAPVAYCLPGLRPRVVLSRGALRVLSEGELVAVLAHERAHARGRHDLVTQPFLAWERTFPFLPTARRAVVAVTLLVEMLADDAAARRCPSGDLRGALLRLGQVPAAAVGGEAIRPAGLAARIDRLAVTTPLSRAATGMIYGAAVALVVVPPFVLVFS